MVVIKNQLDMDRVKQRRDIDTDVVEYLDRYFTYFAGQVGEVSPQGISIEASGMIIFTEPNDTDLTPEFPNIANALPEYVREINYAGRDGKPDVLLHGLFLFNNDYAIDIISVKSEMNGQLAELYAGEIENFKESGG